MRLLPPGRATGLKLTLATLTAATLAAGCASSIESTGSATPTVAMDQPTTPVAGKTPLDVPTVTAGAGQGGTGGGKVTGDNLLTWSDYSAFGVKGLTVRFAAEPGQGPMSTCETGDMRDIPGRTSLWQSTSKAPDPKGLAAQQQIASFDEPRGADSAVAQLVQWGPECTDAGSKQDLDLGGGATASAWRYDGRPDGSELVVLVRLPQRVSYTVISGPQERLSQLDVLAIAGTTAERLG